MPMTEYEGERVTILEANRRRFAKRIGELFEKDLAAEFGIERVPGSGNQWHSKLDVKGRGARWSLKATSNSSFVLKMDDIEEAINATMGPGGTGEVPLWAIRLRAWSTQGLPNVQEDLVVMRKDDFKMLCTGEYEFVQETKSDAKRRVASIPQLLREAEEDE